jgi:hypothetical protein
MKPRHKNSLKPVTDKQLSAALAGLRTDVAAPADFRAKLLLRLQQEGLVKDRPAPARASLWQRLGLTLPRLAAGVSMALVLVVVVKMVAKPGLRGPVKVDASVQPGTSDQALVASKGGGKVPAEAANEGGEQTLAMASPKPKAETMPDALLDKTGASQELGPVGGAEAAAVNSSSSVVAAPAAAAGGSIPSTGAGVPIPAGSVSSASLAPKPTIVVVTPVPTAVTNPLLANSQLRGNEIRASQGQFCVFLYKVLKTGHVHVEIFDRLGRSIAVLKDGDQDAGQYELHWGGQNDQGSMAASGIYVLRLTTPDYNAQHKLLLVK